MLIVGPDRDKLLHCLPKGGRVAEIGVATGDFAEAIYNRSAPMELHLIDPWVFQDEDDYQLDCANVPQREADQRYLGVCERFAAQIEAEVIKVHRDFSHNVAAQFPDEYFDWVYVDAKHTYEACLSDLRAFAPKVKADGFICGHDYANNLDSQTRNFGVVEAVDQFVLETGFHFALLTYEVEPSYVIAKSVGHPSYMALMRDVEARCGYLVEIRNASQKSFQHIQYQVGGGRQGFFYAFD